MGLEKEMMVGKCEDEMDEGEGLHISSVFGVGMMKMKVTGGVQSEPVIVVVVMLICKLLFGFASNIIFSH